MEKEKTNKIKERIEQLKKEMRQHQLELQAMQQRQTQLNNLIISKRGGIIELNKLMEKEKPKIKNKKK